MIKKDKIETNTVLNVARFFAIVSVIMAHSRSLSYCFLNVFTKINSVANCIKHKQLYELLLGIRNKTNKS